MKVNVLINTFNLLFQFPKLCIFQRLNYTIVLNNLDEDREVMLPQMSLLPPVELLIETIESDVVPDAEYTVFVYVLTDVGNSTSHLYNFSEFSNQMSCSIQDDIK